MACKSNSNKEYAARIRARNCDGQFVNLCCIDNVLLNMDNTERLRQITQDGCVSKDVRRLTASITADIYKIDNASVLWLMFPNGAYSEQLATPVVGATQTLTEGQWSSDDAEDKFYRIENRNDDNTIVTNVTIAGTVDLATLVDGVDYEIVLQELCNSDGSKYSVSYIRIIATGGFANNLTTDAQNLEITYDYTPRATWIFSVTIGSYASTSLDIVVQAVNKADETDYMTFEAEGSFSIAGGVFQFNSKDDELVELGAIWVTLDIDTGTELKITWLSATDSCGEACN